MFLVKRSAHSCDSMTVPLEPLLTECHLLEKIRVIQSKQTVNDCLSVEEGIVSRLLAIEDMIDRYPGTSRQTWAQARYDGTGPSFLKVGRRVFCRVEDVMAWEESGVRDRTDAYTA